MGFFEFLKSERKHVEKVGLADLQREREASKHADMSKFEPVKKSGHKFDKIRMGFISLDDCVGYGVDKPKISIVYGRTCNYSIPEGMKMEDVYKVVSYLSHKVDLQSEDPAISESNVCDVAYILGNYGFQRTDEVVPDYSHYHEFIDYKYPGQKVNVSDVLQLSSKEDADELLIFDGDMELFVRSDMFNKNTDWFVSDVSFKDVKKIYAGIGLNIGKNGVVGPANASVKQ